MVTMRRSLSIRCGGWGGGAHPLFSCFGCVEKMFLMDENQLNWDQPACCCVPARRRHLPGHLQGVFPHGVSRPREAEAEECPLQTLLQVKPTDKLTYLNGSVVTDVGEGPRNPTDCLIPLIWMKNERQTWSFSFLRRICWPRPPQCLIQAFVCLLFLFMSCFIFAASVS